MNALTLNERGIENFLSSLELAPIDERPEFLLWRDDFPLVIQGDALELAMKAWFHRLSPDAVQSPSKENQPMLMTSAPTGSGKTVFLRLLCQLFRKKWDVDSFLNSLIPELKEECGEEEENFQSLSKSRDDWLQGLAEVLNNLKESFKSKKLIPPSKLAKSFLTSIHPCFVSFNSTSPITDFETAMLGKSPELMLIARVIFAELKTDNLASTDWCTRYDQFLEKHLSTILRFPPSSTLRYVMTFMLRKFNCEHYMLALDEVILLNQLPTVASNPQPQITVRPFASTGVGKVLKMVGQIIMIIPGFAGIVSSIVTGPLEEYLLGSKQDHAFIPLHPFLDQLSNFAEFIMAKRGVRESYHPVMRMLVASGGHPTLLSKMISWLSTPYVACDEMTLKTAAQICLVGNKKLYDPPIAETIFTGSPAREEDVAVLSGLADSSHERIFPIRHRGCSTSSICNGSQSPSNSWQTSRRRTSVGCK